MERSFSVGGVLGGGTGNVVVINEVSTDGASDVLDVDARFEEIRATRVELVLWPETEQSVEAIAPAIRLLTR